MAEQPRTFGSVTIYGGATLDRIARSSAKPVMGASNPGTVRRSPGGVGFNVAAVLARLGIPTRLVTRLGDDDEGRTVTETARKVGIELLRGEPRPGERTASYSATLDESGDLVVGIADASILEDIAPGDVAAAAAASPADDFWVVDANLPTDTLYFLAGEAATRGRTLAALTVSPAKAGRLTPLLDRISYIFTNRLEAGAILGKSPAAAGPTLASKLASALSSEFGVRAVVTNGTEPLASAAGGDVRSYMPLKANVSAVNGAGDSLAAGIIRGLTAGLALPEAVRFGLAAAAMTLEAGSVLDAPFNQDALALRIAGGRVARVTA